MQTKDYKNISFIFTNRLDGNLAFHVGDDAKVVDANHEKLAKKLGYDKISLVHMKQIHSDIVHVVDENDNYKNPLTCDALITDKKDTPLMVMVADCTPIIFYDAKKGVIAVAHAGRAGAFKNIVKNVIDKFVSLYNSEPKDITVKLGSSICCDCYEVGVEIYEEAKELNLDYAIKKQNGSYYLDITKILKNQLLDAGVVDIEVSKECSCCCDEKYFSYRANQKTGRFCGVVKLS